MELHDYDHDSTHWIVRFSVASNQRYRFGIRPSTRCERGHPDKRNPSRWQAEVVFSVLRRGTKQNSTGRTKYPPTVQNSTLTSAARRQLVEYGAIENDSDPHDFGDIRKTVLTNVLHGQPSSFTKAHRIARHARETFFVSYELDVPSVQADVLERLATMEETPPLTVVMLA